MHIRQKWRLVLLSPRAYLVLSPIDVVPCACKFMTQVNFDKKQPKIKDERKYSSKSIIILIDNASSKNENK